jgi:sRNA-binding carbon storage regulator CsrA
MHHLRRTVAQHILLGDNVYVTIARIPGERVRLQITAPDALTLPANKPPSAPRKRPPRHA